jgi:hypothetical protein
MTDTTSSRPPVACSLGPAGYARRTEAMADLAHAALRGREPIAHGTRLTFGDRPGMHARLSGLVAAEARCCPFLTLELRRCGDGLVLEITGPDEAAPVIAELFS